MPMRGATTSTKWRWVVVILVALLTVAAHVRGLRGEFLLWDDDSHITQNAAIRALTWDNVRAMFTGYIAKLYCPLTWLSFAIDYQLWERNAFGYHLTNVLLHLVNTLLVMTLAYRLLTLRPDTAAAVGERTSVRSLPELSLPVAALTAVMFGVHPLHVTSVAWVTERKDVLFVCFYLLALLAYLCWSTSQRRWAYWSCFLLFVASVLSKSTAVTLPVVLLLLDVFWSRRLSWGRSQTVPAANACSGVWREKIPFFLVSAIVAVETVVAQFSGRGETIVSIHVIPLAARAGLVGYCTLFYVRKFLAPWQLSAIYPSFDEMDWTAWTGAGWLLVFVGVTAAVVMLRRRAPVLLPAWCFYLVTLSPTIGVAPGGIHVVADYYSYLPLLGLAFATSAGLVLLCQQWRVAIVLPVAIVIGWTVLSAKQTAIWVDTETLFQNVLKQYPRCLPAHVNLTFWYTGHQRFTEAIEHGRQAVQIAPAGLPGRKNLAFAYLRAGRPRETVDVLAEAIRHGVDDAEVWRALYEAYTELGDETNARAARMRWDRFISTSPRTQDQRPFSDRP